VKLDEFAVGVLQQAVVDLSAHLQQTASYSGGTDNSALMLELVTDVRVRCANLERQATVDPAHERLRTQFQAQRYTCACPPAAVVRPSRSVPALLFRVMEGVFLFTSHGRNKTVELLPSLSAMLSGLSATDLSDSRACFLVFLARLGPVGFPYLPPSLLDSTVL
jgi:hypothetical protein